MLFPGKAFDVFYKGIEAEKLIALLGKLPPNTLIGVSPTTCNPVVLDDAYNCVGQINLSEETLEMFVEEPK